MAQFVNDTFTGVDGTNLESHTGETGATWTVHPSGVASAKIQTNRVQPNGAFRAYYASGVPGSADYDVEAVIRKVTGVSNMGIVGRMSTSADTGYLVLWGPSWTLFSLVAGVAVSLGTFTDVPANGTDRTVRLKMRGSDIRVLIDGVERIAVTDASVTAAGRVGIRGGGAAGTSVAGYHVDSVKSQDAFAVALSDSLAASDALGKTAGKPLADSVTASDSASKAPGKTAADSLTATDALLRGMGLTRADTLTASDAPAKAATHPLADSLTASDAISKAPGPHMADTLTASDSTAKGAGKAASDSLTASDALAKAFGLAKADSLSPSDLLALAEGFHLGLSDSLTATDSLSRQWVARLPLADDLALAEAISRATGIGLADSLVLADAITTGNHIVFATIPAGRLVLGLLGGLASQGPGESAGPTTGKTL